MNMNACICHHMSHYHSKDDDVYRKLLTMPPIVLPQSYEKKPYQSYLELIRLQEIAKIMPQSEIDLTPIKNWSDPEQKFLVSV